MRAVKGIKSLELCFVLFFVLDRERKKKKKKESQ